MQMLVLLTQDLVMARFDDCWKLMSFILPIFGPLTDPKDPFVCSQLFPGPICFRGGLFLIKYALTRRNTVSIEDSCVHHSQVVLHMNLRACDGLLEDSLQFLPSCSPSDDNTHLFNPRRDSGTSSRKLPGNCRALYAVAALTMTNSHEAEVSVSAEAMLCEAAKLLTE